MPCNRTDCRAWAKGTPVEANPDISGIGILVGFAASAFFTLLFCTIYYLVDDNASTRLVERPDIEEGKEVLRYRTNAVDDIFRKKVAALLTNTGNLYSKKWSEALQSAVLLYSDQQSLTGIAVLVSGFSQLGCSLTTFHWQLSFDLAWFSSITHLTTLTCLRHYFQKRPALRAWRLLCMAITALMLATSLVSTGFIGSNIDPSFPALCLFRRQDFKSSENDGSYDGWYIGVTSGFLVISYLTRIIQLFPGTTDIVNDYFRVKPRDMFQKRVDAVRNCANRSSSDLFKVQWAILYRFICSLWCLIEAMADLWSSLLWEITWLLIALVWGTIRVVEDQLSQQYTTTASIDVSDEDLWGYGQVLTVILLILPFVSLFEVSYEALSRSTETSTTAKEILDANLSSDATDAKASQDMHWTNDNTAIDRQSQSTISARQRRIRRNTDANEYQAISTLAKKDNLAPLQDAHHTMEGEDVDQQHHLDSGALPTQQRLNFYNYRWFRMLILLIYCLSLIVAAQILYNFPVAGAIKHLKDAGPYLIPKYAKWLAVNFGAIWAFAIVGVNSTTQDVPMPRPGWMTRIGEKFGSCHDRVRGFVPPAIIAWVETIAWTIFVLGVTAFSAWMSYFFIWPK